jgi:hypothetical protein
MYWNFSPNYVAIKKKNNRPVFLSTRPKNKRYYERIIKINGSFRPLFFFCCDVVYLYYSVNNDPTLCR